MKKKNFLIKSIIMLFALVVLGACSNDDDGGSNEVIDADIVELAQANPNLTNLVSALQAAELVTTLQGDGPFTVFAPTDDAFAALLDILGDDYNSLADFDTQAEIDLLTEILLYHVVPQQVLAGDLAAGTVGTALAGNSIEIIASGNTFVIGDASDVDANITGTDILATNGVVHTIDKVLLPQSAIDFVTDLNATIVDLALETPDLSILVEALTSANLVTALQGDGPFTVFAPTNAAFEQFLADNNYPSLGDVPVDILTQVLLNHVVEGENLSTGLSTGYVQSLSEAGVDGRRLSLFIDTDGGVSVNGVADVTAPDNVASNGVVHIVNGVIGLPNIVDHALANGALTELVGALTDGGNTTFTDLLSNPAESFTVFAPVNDAFNAFTNPNSNELANILSNHVIVGTAAISTGLTNSYVKTAATNADGDALDIYINTDNGVTLNGVSTVAIPDIVATNGIIHAVDAVIDLPDVTTFATADPTFSTLVDALTAYSNFQYVAALQTPNGTAPAPFTVFAPTNEAFGDLLTDLQVDGLGDIDEATLASVLELHVVTGANVRAEDLPGIDGANVATLGGQDIVIDANTPAITGPDGNANPIAVTNVQAFNGVIHAITRVIR